MANDKPKKKTHFIHPGVILNDDFLKPLKMTPDELALELSVPVDTVYALVEGECGITLDIAKRLASYFGMSSEFWVSLQSHYDNAIEGGE